MILDKLYKIIKERENNLPKNSYVASLFIQGKDKIIQKVGEEAVEEVIAAKNEGKKRVISESADLVFHLLVLFAALDITPQEIYNELERRMKKG